MILAPEQETALLRQYSPMIRSLVNSFCRNIEVRMRHRDDLLQEANIAFLEHLRRMNNMGELQLCRSAIRRAMYNYMESVSPVHIPHNRFYQELPNISVVPMNFSSEQELFMSATQPCETEAHCVVSDFLHLLEPKEQQLLNLRACGYTNREIVRMLGYSSEWQVGRKLKIIQRQYADYAV